MRMISLATMTAAAALSLSAAAVAAPNNTDHAPRSGANSPTLEHDNPSSCLGAERASRNSNGGDREHGAFGEAQSAYVAYLNDGGTLSYGEFLQQWMDSCTNPPGGPGADQDDDSDD